jgi:hypothetical protein
MIQIPEATLRGRLLLCVLAVLVVPPVVRGDDVPRPLPGAAALSDAEKESFLLEGRIIADRSAGEGITLSRRVTLERGGFEHDAHVQTVNEWKPVMQLKSGPEFDFRDSYKNNIAAYRLDRLLGLGMVPVTVLRHYGQKPAAFTWWVDDVLMDLARQSKEKIPPPDPSRWNCQIDVMRTFDQLIYNMDRNAGNLLIGKGWRVWLIDHTRAFKIFKKLRNEKDLGRRCDRHLLAALKRLDEASLDETMSGLLDSGQVEGLLARRDRIVAHYEAKIAKQGEETALCDLDPPAGTSEAP